MYNETKGAVGAAPVFYPINGLYAEIDLTIFEYRVKIYINRVRRKKNGYSGKQVENPKKRYG